MKFIKGLAVLALCASTVQVAGFSAMAAGQTVEIAPEYSEFNANDVNGGVEVYIPENVDAQVNITVTSPEETAEDYYNTPISSADGNAFSFALEGYDPFFDGEGNIVDGRVYSIEITPVCDLFKAPLQRYTDENIIIPDLYDNKDSKTIYKYELTIEEVEEEPAEPVVVTEGEDTIDGITYKSRFITYYVYEAYLLGDVNEDGFIDASDASAVLAEYALTATGNAPTFTSNQILAADVNEDTYVDSVDASKILKYYADAATGNTPDWN